MKRLIIFLAIFCIGSGFSGGNIFAQTTFDTTDNGQDFIVREFKLIKIYPKIPNKEISTIKIITAINERKDLVVREQNMNWFGAKSYWKLIYKFDYETYNWDPEPEKNKVGQNIINSLAALVFCLVAFLIGLIILPKGDFLRRKLFPTLGISMLHSFVLLLNSKTSYNGIVYIVPKIGNQYVFSTILVIVMIGFLIFGDLIQKRRQKKKMKISTTNFVEQVG
jgi:hypothetical protein